MKSNEENKENFRSKGSTVRQKFRRRPPRGTTAMLAQAGRDMATAISKLQSADEIEQTFVDFLTASELRDLEARWLIFKMLNEGVTQREISRILGVSLCKITRGSRFLKSPKNIVKKLLSANSTADRPAKKQRHERN